MPTRLGPGPVFVYEGLVASRRWQLYAQRAGFVGLILAGIILVGTRSDIGTGPDGRVSLQELAALGQRLFRSFATIEVGLVLLVAPAATAGAVCLDRARGTLDHMLATDLSNTEIVLGKLGVRLIPVLGLIAALLPVIGIAGLMGGIDPLALVGLFLVSVGCALVGCALAMALSIYGSKTHEVLIATYLVIIAWISSPVLLETGSFVLTRSPTGLLGARFMEWLWLTNPFSLPIEPYNAPGRVGLMTYVVFLSVCLAISGMLVGLATARVRRVALAQAGRRAAGSGRWALLFRRGPRLSLPGPSLDANPVAWREWHRRRPSMMMRIAWGFYTALGLLWVFLAMSQQPGSAAGAEQIGVMNMFQVGVGLLLLSVSAATSLAEERVRGSLDVLLSTTMSTRSILAGKWWGSYRAVLGVAIWPAATALFPLADNGSLLAYILLITAVLVQGAAITSLGLATATWVRRLGRAIALCVSVYAAMVVGWPVVVFGVVGRDSPLVVPLGLGDPVWEVAVLSFLVNTGTMPVAPEVTPAELLLAAVVWIAIDLAVAAGLYYATLQTFDRCLGRIPDDGISPARPPSYSSLSTDELLALVPSRSSSLDQDPDPDDE